MTKFSSKNALFAWLWTTVLKTYFHLLSKLPNCKISQKKYLNFRPKMSYAGIFGIEF